MNGQVRVIMDEDEAVVREVGIQQRPVALPPRFQTHFSNLEGASERERRGLHCCL